MEFEPLGEKIYSYQRSAYGKGKAISPATNIDPASEDVVEYEVYHVRTFFPQTAFGFPMLTIQSVNVGHPWVSGVSPKNANIHPPLHRSWFVHRGGRISLGVRGIASPLFSPFPWPNLTAAQGTRSGNEGGRQGWCRTTLRDIHRYTRSTASPKGSG